PDEDVPRQAALERMRRAGASVSIECIDLADHRALRARIEAVAAGHSVAAVVHAAGATHPTPLVDLDEDTWHESWDAKVHGLQQVIAAIGRPIPLVLGLSSVAGVWGARDFVAYAAA